jgi:hypothetical protein
MGLRIWNQLSDLYNHDQLADNWSKVDLHDHTPGRGIRIPAEGIDNEAVIGSKISPAFMQSIEAPVVIVAASVGQTVNLTWPIAYADTTYHVYLTVFETSARCFATLVSKTVTGISVVVRNPTSAASVAGQVQALGVKL